MQKHAYIFKYLNQFAHCI